MKITSLLGRDVNYIENPDTGGRSTFHLTLKVWKESDMRQLFERYGIWAILGGEIRIDNGKVHIVPFFNSDNT